MKKEVLVEYTLRSGLAFSLLYAAIAGILDPSSWVGYVPNFLTAVADKETLLILIGVMQSIIALWILFGKRIFIPSTLAALFILSILVSQFSLLDVIFRDVTVLSVAIALAIGHYPEGGIKNAFREILPARKSTKPSER
ncbi:MAG: hypothetical protein U5L75_02360 [Candidatus Campbellbacteria bacterium]|nr:hypothetical protein [Candidatus Campbellbacteria bacterium]